MLLALLLPTRVAERLLDITEGMTVEDPFHSSMAGNWYVWKQTFWNFRDFFLLGSGWGSRHRLYYESQYVLILAETGFVGSFFYLGLCAAPLRGLLALKALKPKAGNSELVHGWLAGFVGVMAHSLSCVSLTVLKIAVPFWFLTGVIYACLSTGERVDADATH